MIINNLPMPTEDKIDIAEVTVVSTSFSYTGSQQTLVLKYSGITLVKGTDYTVTGTDSATDSGSYNALIKGKGRYAGTKSVSWTISRAYDGDGTYIVTVNGNVVGTGTNTTFYARNLGTNTDITVTVQYTFIHSISASEQSYVKMWNAYGTGWTYTKTSETTGVQAPTITYNVRFSSASGNGQMSFTGESKNYVALHGVSLRLYADAGT